MRQQKNFERGEGLQTEVGEVRQARQEAKTTPGLTTKNGVQDRKKC
jgi:hypothetical protein